MPDRSYFGAMDRRYLRWLDGHFRGRHYVSRFQCKRAISWYKAQDQEPAHRVGSGPIVFPAWLEEVAWRERRRIDRALTELSEAWR